MQTCTTSHQAASAASFELRPDHNHMHHGPATRHPCNRHPMQPPPSIPMQPPPSVPMQPMNPEACDGASCSRALPRPLQPLLEALGGGGRRNRTARLHILCKSSTGYRSKKKWRHCPRSLDPPRTKSGALECHPVVKLFAVRYTTEPSVQEREECFTLKIALTKTAHLAR